MHRRRTVLVVALCAAVTLTACRSEPTTTGTPVPTTGVVPASALAASFAPLVHLGAGEHNPPMDASTFIAGSKLVWVHDDGCPDKTVAEHPAEAELAHGGYQAQLTNGICKSTGRAYTTSDRTRPYDMPELGAEGFVLTAHDDALHEQGSTDAPVYLQYVPVDRTGRKAYIYWFFYPYNDFPGPIGDHEGDWERITVATDAADKPVRVVFSHHGKACAAAWSDVAGPDGHPVVYSATGAHGSYPRAGSYDYPKRPDDQTSDAGRTWAAWPHLEDVEKQKWWGYKGGWGKKGHDLSIPGTDKVPADLMTGPAGPFEGRDMTAEAFTETPCPAPAHPPATAATTSATSAAPTTSTSSAPAKTTEGAIQRMEQFLHATGRSDVRTMCEIAGPAAKKAEDEGMGPCESTFPVTLSMISAAQKAALREATVDPAKVSVHGGQVEVPASAVRASVPFTSSDLGDFTLEYRGADWYIVD
jgi:hypothetical protein